VVIRKVTVNGRQHEVSLSADGTFRVDDRTGAASVVEMEPGLFSVLWEGRHYEARSRNGAVYVNGTRFAVEVEDPRAPKARAGSGVEGRHTLKASMPGKIVRVLLDEGDEVAAGQGVVVVEAMKMQNEVRSPKAGRIVSIGARVGAAVAAGDPLAVVE
jgi:biotin carboxyl carrier protein